MNASMTSSVNHSTHPMKGDTPVPGPIMMMGRDGSAGRRNRFSPRGTSGTWNKDQRSLLSLSLSLSFSLKSAHCHFSCHWYFVCLALPVFLLVCNISNFQFIVDYIVYH